MAALKRIKLNFLVILTNADDDEIYGICKVPNWIDAYYKVLGYCKENRLFIKDIWYVSEYKLTNPVYDKYKKLEF